MVWKTGIRRVRGGKTLKIDLLVENGIVEDIVISGDFFAYPETVIDEIEDSIRGKSVSEAIDALRSFRDRVELVGISFKDLESLFIELISS
ncbi:MAG: lipoate protein ligase C-terminal domain-containing protein [Thermoprotei archaeon]